MPKGPVETPITDQEIAFAHLILAGKLTDREAAEAVGINPGQAYYVKAKPRVKEYMASHRASVRAGLVQHEVDALAEFNIGREQILAKWWEFANIDPAKTGYNTASQSKALDSLWKALGFDGSSKPGEEESEPEKPDIYVAKWLREARGEKVEDDEEEATISREGESSNEPKLSSPELPPIPEPVKIERRPAPEPVPQGVQCQGSAFRNRGPEPPVPYAPGASFGRFQGT